MTYLYFGSIVIALFAYFWFISLPVEQGMALKGIPRFSLRTLLLVTTLIAVLLGLVVWSSR